MASRPDLFALSLAVLTVVPSTITRTLPVGLSLPGRTLSRRTAWLLRAMVASASVALVLLEALATFSAVSYTHLTLPTIYSV